MSELAPAVLDLQATVDAADRIHSITARARAALGRTVVASMLIVSGALAAFGAGEVADSEPALAAGITYDDLGYPWKDAACEFGSDGGANCHNPGNSADKYDWGVYDDRGIFHPYRDGQYEYRNCTDYVAWKLQSLGVSASKTNGLGNGGDWYANAPASERSTTPKAGDAAVRPTTATDAFGHLAFVEAVNSDGTITVSEYNYDTHGDGDKRTGTAASLGFTEFVDFGATSPGNSGNNNPGPTNNVTAMSSQRTPDGNEHIYWATADGILRETWFNATQGAFSSTIRRFGKVVTALSSQYSPGDGLQHVYAGTADGDIDEFWFGPNTGGYQGRVITNIGSRVMAMSSQYTPDGTQHIYYATADRLVEETWFNPSQGDHTYLRDNESNSPIQALTTQIGTDGTIHIYWGNDEGRLHERYISGNNTGLNVMASFPRPITALSSQTTPDGKEHVYSGTDDGTIRETWFDPTHPGSGFNSWEAAHIGAKVMALSSQYTANDGTQHIYSGSSTGTLSETWFRPGTVNSWQVALNPAPAAITAISSEYTASDGTQHVFWGASDGYARETWFRPGTVNTWQIPASP